MLQHRKHLQIAPGKMQHTRMSKTRTYDVYTRVSTITKMNDMLDHNETGLSIRRDAATTRKCSGESAVQDYKEVPQVK